MKLTASILALVALVSAQTNNSYNAIDIPNGGLQVTAGQPLTITWSNPSSSTVTIKLQQGAGATPNTGITLLTGVPASDKTATFTIQADEVNVSDYDIEIIDDSNPDNINFSTNFAVSGATCVGTCDGGAATTGSAATTGAATTTVSSTTATGSSASSSASASSASVSSSSASASSSLMSSLSSSASSASASTSSASSAASSSASAAATTSAPNAGGAASVKAQAGLVVALIAAIAAF